MADKLAPTPRDKEPTEEEKEMLRKYKERMEKQKQDRIERNKQVTRSYKLTREGK